MSRLTLAALVSLLAGCAPGVTIDEAYGRPDAADWTYFEGSSSAVVDALVDVFRLNESVRVENVEDDTAAGGVVLTVSGLSGTPDYNQILVQRSSTPGFGARAQLYPRQDPLPRDLEIAVSGRITRRSR